MKKHIIFVAVITILTCGSNVDNNFYLINGKNHLFKVFTPKNWINNIDIAHKNGMSTFFHPESAVNSQYHEVYIYANGYDLNSSSATFENFIKQEKSNMFSESKDINLEIIKYDITDMKGIKQIKCFSFINIPNSYRDDCVYIDTGKSVIALIFTANSPKAYLENKTVFEEFISKFSFISSNPDEIKKIIEKDKKDRPDTKYYKVPEQ